MALSWSLVGLALFGGVASAAPPVAVESVVESKVPAVRVTPASGAGVAVPSCRGVVWQRFDSQANTYIPISTRACGAMSPATTLTAEGTTFEVDAAIKDGDVVRAVVVAGTGCASGLPFELAGCDVVVAVEGPTITVRGFDGD